jgi:SAM-dependent methyltransferase
MSARIRDDSMTRALNLGCGDDRIPGTIGVDLRIGSLGADVICDLNRFPYPFRSGSFDRIICHDVIEHLDDIPRCMEEIHRLCRPGARVLIRTPHFSSHDGFTDPTHKHHLAARSLDFCLEGGSMPGVKSKVRFRLVRRELEFYRFYRLLGLAYLANRFTNRYEAHWAFLCPAGNMFFELEAIQA